ncbi:4a-hydroxytetrahydrobiopterin dehydratase [Akkermansiaceae bacterium]|nr:4a-hydroxytetrahydrobiopterin dehydratase [Akkermansiaceae bacterium]MDB4544370.1 4a-hydroxytetrahydrobiopterin dehydratase [Akkermansiaceae bacterium]
MRRSILGQSEREDHLKQCPDWQDDGTRISRTFKFDTYMEGMAFANALAEIAEKANHHPDMLITYRSVTVTLTTHDQGGVTLLDINFAQQIERWNGA